MHAIFLKTMSSIHLALARNAFDLSGKKCMDPPGWQEMHSIFLETLSGIHHKRFKKNSIRRISFKKIGVIDYPAPLDIYVGSSAIESIALLDPRPLREKMGVNRKWKPSAKCLAPITNGNPLILILEVARCKWDENPRISQVNVQIFFPNYSI